MFQITLMNSHRHVITNGFRNDMYFMLARFTLISTEVTLPAR